jgi:hypothetical protein
MIAVYHGSYIAIDEVNLSLCEKGKDFGRGFYVTNLREQAEIWAARIGKGQGIKGVVTEFEFDEYIFTDRDMKVLRFDDYTDEWLDFVVLNRLNKSDEQAHDYDIVEGPVANDRVATRVNMFIDGKISREQFMSDLVYNPSHQICFCTAQSLQALSLPKIQRWVHYDIDNISDEVVQALMSKYGVTEDEAIDMLYTSQTYASVSDESTNLYLKPWQEIYEMLKEELKM